VTNTDLQRHLDKDIPLTSTELCDLTFEGFEIGLEIDKLDARQKLIKKLLVREAASDPGAHQPLPESDGTVWKQTAAGCEAAVIFPTDSLKAQIPSDGKVVDKLGKLVPEKNWSDLFEVVTAWAPREKFRETAARLLGSSVAEKVVRLCTTASSPKVQWKETA
jgi:hypothetical protein